MQTVCAVVILRLHYESCITCATLTGICVFCVRLPVAGDVRALNLLGKQIDELLLGNRRVLRPQDDLVVCCHCAQSTSETRRRPDFLSRGVVSTQQAGTFSCFDCWRAPNLTSRVYYPALRRGLFIGGALSRRAPAPCCGMRSALATAAG